jgi:hypothetical protein
MSLTVARYRRHGLAAARPTLFALAWHAPQRLAAVRAELADELLEREWHAFERACEWGSVAEAELPAWFPAWFLVEHPVSRTVAQQILPVLEAHPGDGRLHIAIRSAQRTAKGRRAAKQPTGVEKAVMESYRLVADQGVGRRITAERRAPLRTLPGVVSGLHLLAFRLAPLLGLSRRDGFLVSGTERHERGLCFQGKCCPGSRSSDLIPPTTARTRCAEPRRR